MRTDSLLALTVRPRQNQIPEMNSAPHLPLERLECEVKATGETSLRLTTQVSWDRFPSYAQGIVDVFQGSIIERTDSPIERLWKVRIYGQRFWLSFADTALGVSLAPLDPNASSLIPVIRQLFLHHRQT